MNIRSATTYLHIFGLVAIISACASIGPDSVDLPLDLLNNRASLPFSTDSGGSYIGATTLQRRAGIGTKITFTLPPNTILFQLDNCARERVEVRPKGTAFTYLYRPSLFKESEDSCVMQAQATTSKGEIQTAIIDWTDARRLQARMWCNEEMGVEQTGVAFCQNRAGKLMWIEFAEEVVTAEGEGCPPATSAKYNPIGKVFEIQISDGLCAYGFMSKGRERLRLTTYGYSTIREVNLEAEKAGR